MTTKQKRSIFNKWVRILGLNDWTIEFIPNSNPDDFINEDMQGETCYTEVRKTATIRILDEKYYGDRLIPFDFEYTVIHELLHLKFHFLEDEDDDSSLYYRVLHELIDDLSKSFMKVKNLKDN